MGARTLGSVLAAQRQPGVTVDIGRDRQRPLAVSVVTAAIAFAALSKGAFYDSARSVLLAVVVVPAVFFFRPWRRPRVAAPHLAALALAASAVLSGVVNDRTRMGLATAALLLAASVLLEAARRLRGPERGQLADALVWLGAGVALFGWWAVAVRWWPYALPDQGLWRAATTFTYANASAAFLVPLYLVSIARSTADPTPTGPPASTATTGSATPAALMAPYALLVGLGATQSRGGVLALSSGVVVLFVLSPRRGAVFSRLAATGAGAAVAVTALLPLSPIDTAANPAMAAVALAGGALLTRALSILPLRPLVVMAAVGIGLTATAVLTVPAVTTARATLGSQDRIDEAVAAVRTWQRQPLVGAGAGIVFPYIAGDGRGPMVARFAHNEYLQLLAEQGALGALVLAAGAVATGRALSRARTRTRDVPPPLWAGCVAALAAFSVHSALDFVWHIPALPLLAAVLLGLALPRKEHV